MSLSFDNIRLPAFARPAVAAVERRLKLSPLGQRLAKGALWSLAGAFATRVLAMACSIFVVRLLGKHKVGELGMIQSTMGLLGTMSAKGTRSRSMKLSRVPKTLPPTKTVYLSPERPTRPMSLW